MGRAAKVGYTPRPQFIPFHKRRQRFACLVCHRGAGKTVASINDLNRAALDAPAGSKFAYIAPYLKQAKAVAWGYLREATAPLAGLGVTANESELRVDYGAGRSVRLFGADNPDAIRGNHFRGIVADEFADWDPSVWPLVVRPALSTYEGSAVFIGTPRGHNAFYQVWHDAQDREDWFTLMLRASETGIFSDQELQSARESLTEDQYAQEYECNFEAAVTGAYYAKLLNAAADDKRITGVPYEPSVRVYTAWDLGVSDATAIWFAQMVGKEIHVFDYYEASGVGLGHYVTELSRGHRNSYIYECHLLPHDAQARELGTGKSRLETLQSLGLGLTRIVTNHKVEDGINAVRMLIPKCWFDKVKCDRGIEALKLYRADTDKRYFDPISKQPLLKPHAVHDWTSHAADAFRYLAMGINDKAGRPQPLVYPKLSIA